MTVGSPAVVRATSLDSDPLKKDFRNFMYKTWMTLFGNAPSPRMYDFGDRLQSGPDKDIDMGFRGFSKSYITVDFGVWALYCDPTEIVLTVSGSDQGAKGNATLAYGMVNGFDWLAHMKPSGMLRSSAQAFDVQGSRMEKSESFAAMSLFGQITGRRASLIIPDDVETPNTSETEGDRSRLRVRYAELGGSILKPGGRIKVLGTSQTEQTLYLELATERGYGMCMYPAIYPRPSLDPKKDELKKYGPWLAASILKELRDNPELAGTPTEPTRFTTQDLMVRELEYGTTEFDRQFRLFLDAGAANDKPLRLRDIPVIEVATPSEGKPLRVPAELTWSPSPDHKWEDIPVDALNGDSTVFAASAVDAWQTPERIILEVDPSGEGKDETAWGVVAQHLGRVFLCHLDARLEGFTDDTLKAIARDAKTWGATTVRIEKNYGGGMFGELLRPHLQAIQHPCSIEEENAGQVQKEVRIIDTLQPVITAHRLVIAAEVLRRDFHVKHPEVEQAKRRFYRLTYQLTRITKSRGCIAHDDRVDMMASAVRSFIGVLKRQLTEAAQQSKDEFIAREAEKILEQRRKLGLPIIGEPKSKPANDRLGNFFNRGQAALRDSLFFQGRQR